MYCEEHKYIGRFNAIEKSYCVICGKEFYTFNAPPINSICAECSEDKNVCELCGEKLS